MLAGIGVAQQRDLKVAIRTGGKPRSTALCANMSETTLLQKLVYNVGAEETKQ
jgi:hypothetical protein